MNDDAHSITEPNRRDGAPPLHIRLSDTSSQHTDTSPTNTDTEALTLGPGAAALIQRAVNASTPREATTDVVAAALLEKASEVARATEERVGANRNMLMYYMDDRRDVM